MAYRGALSAPGRAFLLVIPGEAGIHNHRRPWMKKARQATSQNLVRCYGSRPSRDDR